MYWFSINLFWDLFFVFLLEVLGFQDASFLGSHNFKIHFRRFYNLNCWLFNFSKCRQFLWEHFLNFYLQFGHASCLKKITQYLTEYRIPDKSRNDWQNTEYLTNHAIPHRLQNTWKITQYLTEYRIPDKSRNTWQNTEYLTNHAIPDRIQNTSQITQYLTEYRIPDKLRNTWQNTEYLTNHAIPDRWLFLSEEPQADASLLL